MASREEYTETWYQKLWRPLVAIIYLIIVIFDFIIMPVYVENINKGINFDALDKITQLTEAQAQVEVIRKVNLGDREWEPLTLMGGGLFHVAFGSILTGAAITRGMEKQRRLQQSLYYDDYSLYNRPYGGYYDNGYYPPPEPRRRGRKSSGRDDCDDDSTFNQSGKEPLP